MKRKKPFACRFFFFFFHIWPEPSVRGRLQPLSLPFIFLFHTLVLAVSVSPPALSPSLSLSLPASLLPLSLFPILHCAPQRNPNPHIPSAPPAQPISSAYLGSRLNSTLAPLLLSPSPPLPYPLHFFSQTVVEWGYNTLISPKYLLLHIQLSSPERGRPAHACI
ncbi:unnamed protein product [Mortierella alpina]